MEPDGIDCYNGLAYLYDKMKRYEDALLEGIKEAINFIKTTNENE